MNEPVQLTWTYDGRIVEALALEFGDLKFDAFPEGLDDQALGDIAIGDEIEATVRFKVEEIGHNVKHDRMGQGTKPLARHITCKMLRSGFKVSAVVSVADIEAIWAKAHGATA